MITTIRMWLRRRRADKRHCAWCLRKAAAHEMTHVGDAKWVCWDVRCLRSALKETIEARDNWRKLHYYER